MTLEEFYSKYENKINEAIRKALTEDGFRRDVSSGLFKNTFRNNKTTATLVCKQDCVLAGLDIFKKVFFASDSKIKFITYKKDGDRLRYKTNVIKLISTADKLLSAERTALNFIQRMSGIATLTDMFVKRLKYKKARILHTRKTTPNFRLFEVAAVKIGGGDFHRLNLGSSVMIKDNHIKAAGGLYHVLLKLNNAGSETLRRKKVEIEINNSDQIETLIQYGKGIIDVVMLDNFNHGDIPSASKILKQHGFHVELSGGINLQNFEKIQNKYIDFYSIGMLTHSYNSVDFSLEF